jgi:hypothetical protein
VKSGSTRESTPFPPPPRLSPAPGWENESSISPMSYGSFHGIGLRLGTSTSRETGEATSVAMGVNFRGMDAGMSAGRRRVLQGSTRRPRRAVPCRVRMSGPIQGVTPRRVRLDKISGRSILRAGMDSVDVELGLDVREMLLDRPKSGQDGAFGHRLGVARPIASRLRMRSSSRRLDHGCGSTAARVVSRRTLPWTLTGFEVAGL